MGNTQSITGQIDTLNIEKIINEKLKLNPEEGRNFYILSEHKSTASKLQHIYLQEYFQGFPVFESWIDLHFDEAGELVFYNDELSRLTSDDIILDNALMADKEPFIPIDELCQRLFVSSAETVDEPPLLHQEARLGWWGKTEAVLGVEVIFDYQENLWQVIYAAGSGEVLKQRKLTVSCNFEHADEHHYDTQLTNGRKTKELVCISNEDDLTTGGFVGRYNYFPSGTPSPVYGNRIPETANTIIDPVAAPHGWHDGDGAAATIEYPYTQGNHVYAFYAPDGAISNPPPVAITRDGITGTYLGGNVPFPAMDPLDFNYTADLTNSNPRSYLEDAITNVFVWNNLCHDILYQHGFNEENGNFQALNFGGSSGGGDAVLARVQDGSGFNNASFSTPPDGSSPTMRMFLWDTQLNGDFRDASFEDIIIAHEYAHGLSFRLIGGEENVTCLSNFEQGGEGWSDFIALLLTIDAENDGIVEESALGEGVRSIGNYVLKQGAGGTGIRSRFYSTDMDCPSTTCNDMTYAQLDQLQAPHGVGMLWCTMLWDMTWALIDKYGFEPNWRLTNSTAGNIRALKIVIEGLKMTACNPTFPNMRDAVMTANQALYGAADEELLWEVFARRGLGVDALAGGIADFDIPTAKIVKTVDKIEAEIGETVTYTLTVTNNTNQVLTGVDIRDDLPAGLTVSNGQISNGGTRIGQTISWPSVSLNPGASIVRTFSGTISATEGTTASFSDPVEQLTLAFIPLGGWIMDSGQTNPSSGSSIAWFHPSLPLLMESSLLLNISPTDTHNQLMFWQWYDLESGIDGGVIEIRDGSTWTDLGSRIREHTYTGFMYDALPSPIGVPVPFSTLSGRSGYTDYSGGWQRTVVDLSGYTGDQTIRFRYAADESTDTGECNGPAAACEGWYLDDFFLLDMHSLQNRACVKSDQGYNSCDDVGSVGTIYYAPGALPVEWLYITATALEQHINIKWATVREQDNEGFWLERRDPQGTDFEPIAWVPAGANAQEGTYDYQDFDIKRNETYYYRLRQEDHDGAYTYSEIVSARLSGKPEVQLELFPNPAKDWLQINLAAGNESEWQLQLTDAQGHLWAETTIIDNIQLAVNDWPAACYYLRVFNEQQQLSAKWIKLD